MKVIVAGSRSITDYCTVALAIKISKFEITELVSGAAFGVDKLGEHYAQLHNIPVKQFFPRWNLYGKSAGYIRNEEMAKYADALVCVWDGVSRGSMHMINLAKQHGIKVYVHIPNKEDESEMLRL